MKCFGVKDNMNIASEVVEIDFLALSYVLKLLTNSIEALEMCKFLTFFWRMSSSMDKSTTGEKDWGQILWIQSEN